MKGAVRLNTRLPSLVTMIGPRVVRASRRIGRIHPAIGQELPGLQPTDSAGSSPEQSVPLHELLRIHPIRVEAGRSRAAAIHDALARADIVERELVALYARWDALDNINRVIG